MSQGFDYWRYYYGSLKNDPTAPKVSQEPAATPPAATSTPATQPVSAPSTNAPSQAPAAQNRPAPAPQAPAKPVAPQPQPQKPKEKKEQLSLTGISDPYVWRASYLPALNVDSQFVQDPDQDFGMLRFGLNEWKQMNPYLLKEFYVLTPWHREHERGSFTAYSFFDPETETGVLLAFRGEDCGQSEVSLCLPFTQGKDYILTDADSGKTITTKDEFDLYFECPRQARLLFVKRKNQI